MSEMTTESQAALRKPFPRESIGKLPKGGVQLDYVGHAATTDRLLAVDPGWSWEPFAVGPDGLPALDRSGNLWIRLTVCGVTRIGVGDGKSAKEVIGDAIRNAAMRFGVALDLWSKEELEGSNGAVGALESTPAAPVVRDKPATDDKPMSETTRKRMFALFGERGINDRDEQVRGIVYVIGREVESRGDLTEAEAKAVIETLKAHRAEAGEPA